MGKYDNDNYVKVRFLKDVYNDKYGMRRKGEVGIVFNDETTQIWLSDEFKIAEKYIEPKEEPAEDPGKEVAAKKK